MNFRFLLIIILFIQSCQDTESSSKEESVVAINSFTIGNKTFSAVVFSPDQMHSFGLKEVKNLENWEVQATSHLPLYYKMNVQGKDVIFVNYHGAARLHELKKIILPTPNEIRSLVLSTKDEKSIEQFSKEVTQFIQFKGKVFDVQVANYWIFVDREGNLGHHEVLSVSPNENRFYLSKSNCQSAYPLRTFNLAL